MRNLFILAFLVFFFQMQAQNQQLVQKAIDHIAQKSGEWQLQKADYSDLVLSSMATSEKGITYIYLNQSYQGIPVRNAMSTIVLDAKGKVVSDAHNLISGIAEKVNTLTPLVLPEKAILHAGGHLGASFREQPIAKGRSEKGQLLFSFPELTKSDISAELKLEKTGNSLTLVWNLQLDMVGSADYWDMNIDAVTGEFVSKHNYTTYCTHHHGAFDKHEKCEIGTFRKINRQATAVNKLLHFIRVEQPDTRYLVCL